MDIKLILGFSILLQLIGIAVALWLIRVTGRRLAWLLIAAGITLALVRHSIAFVRSFSGEPFGPPDVSGVGASFIISMLMLTGVSLIMPMFLSIRRSEQAARASEQRYRAIVEGQTDLVCRWLPDTTLTFVNEAYCRFFGKERDELIGKSFLQLVPEGEQQVVRERFVTLDPGDRFQSHEYRVAAPKGKVRWQHWVNHAILDDDGQVLEYQTVGRDVTKRPRGPAETDRGGTARKRTLPFQYLHEHSGWYQYSRS